MKSIRIICDEGVKKYPSGYFFLCCVFIVFQLFSFVVGLKNQNSFRKDFLFLVLVLIQLFFSFVHLLSVFVSIFTQIHKLNWKFQFLKFFFYIIWVAGKHSTIKQAISISIPKTGKMRLYKYSIFICSPTSRFLYLFEDSIDTWSLQIGLE